MIATNNILSVFDTIEEQTPDEIAIKIAQDFKKRRIEKNLTQQRLSEMSGVAISNITRFEQKGLISFNHLITLAIALDFTNEVSSIFSQPKYSTMEELTTIRKNSKRSKAYGKPQQ